VLQLLLPAVLLLLAVQVFRGSKAGGGGGEEGRPAPLSDFTAACQLGPASCCCMPVGLHSTSVYHQQGTIADKQSISTQRT